MPTSKILRHVLATGALLSCATSWAAALDVHITHLRPTQQVRVAVYPDAESWEQDRPVATRVVAARGTAQTVRIEGLAPGRYAVRVHQAPNDGGLAEPASFAVARRGSSNNKSAHGVPDFERAAVVVGPAGARVPVHLFISSRF